MKREYSQQELVRLARWLEMFDERTEALPSQHEMPSWGCCTYNWHSRVVRDAKAFMEGRMESPKSPIFVTEAIYPTFEQITGKTQPCGYCKGPKLPDQNCGECGYPDPNGDWARECKDCGRHPSNCACGC